MTWFDGGWRSEDFDAGLQYAAKENLIDTTGSGGSYQLTEAGYDRGGGAPLIPSRWAEDILDILVNRFHRRPGEPFEATEFQHVWFQDSDHRVADFDEGLAYAVEHGWLEQIDDKTYKLTTKGQAIA